MTHRDNRKSLKDELVRMIRTVFGIGAIRQFVVSVLEVEVKLRPVLNVALLMRRT